MLRHKLQSLACGWLLCAAVAGQAADPDRAVIDRLIRDLNAGSLSTRDAAEQALVAHGPVILPWITTARAEAAGEAALRLRGIQQQLEDAAAAETVEAALETLAVRVAAVESIGGDAAARIVLRATWAPPLVPLAVRLPMRSVVAEGPGGESMPTAQRQAVIEAAVSPQLATVDLPIMLDQPTPRLESLGLLRGTVMLWLAGRDHEFAFPLREPVPHTLHVARAMVRLDEAAVRAGRLLVTATVTYDEPTEALASHRTWLTHRPLDVVADAAGPLERLEQSTIARSDRGLTAMAAFALPEGAGPTVIEALEVRWRLPIAIHEVPFDFAIRDVPLPAGR